MTSFFKLQDPGFDCFESHLLLGSCHFVKQLSCAKKKVMAYSHQTTSTTNWCDHMKRYWWLNNHDQTRLNGHWVSKSPYLSWWWITIKYHFLVKSQVITWLNNHDHHPVATKALNFAPADRTAIAWVVVKTTNKFNFRKGQIYIYIYDACICVCI